MTSEEEMKCGGGRGLPEGRLTVGRLEVNKKDQMESDIKQMIKKSIRITPKVSK